MLPPDGTGHTQALFITVMCRNMVVARVLIDNGSALNVRPLITLQKLGVEESQIQPNNMTIRAFDGSKKKAIGEIDLAVESGNPPELARRRRKAGSIRLAEWKALDSPAYSPSDSNRRIDPLTEFPLELTKELGFLFGLIRLPKKVSIFNEEGSDAKFLSKPSDPRRFLP